MAKNRATQMGWRALFRLDAREAAMNQADILLSIIDMERQGGALTAEDAIAGIAEFIDRLEPANPGHERNVEILLSIGACIWRMRGA